ncbi:MAG: DUF4652 domain-containing protein [Anaerobacillus sp.]|uniref:DUF4652 domain-containing protein n=1 Tax=Anaerobacillus sp. TaxID=1872506 RepID=UPI00391A680E
MYTIHYEKSSGNIIVTDKNNVIVLSENRFSSEPSFNRNRKRAVYITPLEWETQSNLIMFHLALGKREIIDIPIDDTKMVKNALWLSDSLLVLIIGYTRGKRAIGGRAYSFDIEQRQLHPLCKYDGVKKQVINFEKRDKSLLLDVIEFTSETDELFNRKKEVINMLSSGLL